MLGSSVKLCRRPVEEKVLDLRGREARKRQLSGGSVELSKRHEKSLPSQQ